MPNNANYLKKGDWNYYCQRCGFKYKFVSGRIREEWTHLHVCPECWEERHPQDFVKPVFDNQNVATSNPRPTPIFIDD